MTIMQNVLYKHAKNMEVVNHLLRLRLILSQKA